MAYAQKRKLPKKKQLVKKAEGKGPAAEDILVSAQDDEDVAMPVESMDGESAAEEAIADAEDTTRDTESVQHDLSSIYGMDEEKPVDMTKLDQKYSRGRWVIGAVLIAALIGVVVYLGYRVFHEGGSRNGDVEITIDAENRVASGDVVTIEVEYVNKKNVDITSGDIELFYPEGFYVQSTVPESIDDHQRSWRIEDVKPGAGGKIRIVGQLVGEKDEVKDFSALVTYRPSNFSRDFQETTKVSVTITSSIVDLTVDAPTQVASNQEMTYTVEYRNTSSVPLRDVKMTMAYPDGFTFASASQEPWSGNTEWRMDTLQPNETHTLTITGAIAGESGETKEFAFQLGLIEIDNSFHVQVSKTSLVIMVNPEVELAMTAPEIVSVGENVAIEVVVKNTSEAELKDVDVRLSCSGALCSETEYAFDQIKKLSPHEEKTLRTAVQLSEAAAAENQTLEVVARVVSALVNGASVAFPNQTAATMKVGDDIGFTAQGRYYDDDLTKIGSGPIPPTIGEKTTYVIFWTLSNGQNDVEDLRMAATLPEHVEWEDDASNGITFNEETRQVQYARDTLNAGTELSMEFSVSVTPKSSDVNKLLVLTEEIILTAQNTFTGESITQNQPRMTTDLPGDEGASGKGVVEK